MPRDGAQLIESLFSVQETLRSLLITGQLGWAPQPEAQATALVASRGRRWEACGLAPPSSVVMGGLRPLKAPGSTG